MLLSFSSLPGDVIERDDMKSWASKNPDLVEYLQFQPFSQQNFPPSPKSLAAAQKLVMEELSDYQSKLKNVEEEITSSISAQSRTQIPSVGLLCYDTPRQNMQVRIQAFIRRYMHRSINSIYSSQFSTIADAILRVDRMMSFFKPYDVPFIPLIRKDFFGLDLELSVKADKAAYKRCLTFEKHLAEEIQKFPKPVWVSNFPEFVNSLVTLLLPHIDSDLSYAHPSEMEVSLSRALFHPQSDFLPKIDEVVETIRDVDAASFTKAIITLCYDVMPQKATASSGQQSVALLILFRAIFNRCYEKCSDFFAPKAADEMKILWEVSKMPAALFPLPKPLLGEEVGLKSIREIFRGNQYFLSASQFLNQSLFYPNPIDALFSVHKCLIAIHKGALINRLGGTDAKIEDVNQLLCFDDLFSLFFGSLTASDIPDFFYLSWFIDSFSPKQSLSPSFEYAQANLEALVLHIHNLNLENLKKEAADLLNGKGAAKVNGNSQ